MKPLLTDIKDSKDYVGNDAAGALIKNVARAVVPLIAALEDSDLPMRKLRHLRLGRLAMPAP